MKPSALNPSPRQLESARVLFDWLALCDSPPALACDAVVGFGHFDLAIPRQCAELHKNGAARHIIFTGGIGAGTADLGGPEADVFLTVLIREYPSINGSRVVVENRSTNTGENIRFTRDVLNESHPELALGRGIRSVVLVATPCRQRRVWLTWRQFIPAIPAYNAPAAGDFEHHQQLFASKGQDFLAQLLGEFERIRDYPARGWIAGSQIPNDVAHAASVLTPPR